MKVPFQSAVRVLALLLVVTVATVGCSQPAATPTAQPKPTAAPAAQPTAAAAPPTAAAAAKPTAASAAAPTQAAPAKAAQPTYKLRVAAGTTSFAFAPLYVAIGADLFKEEGVDLEMSTVGAGATPIAALFGGSVDIAAIGIQAAADATQQGRTIVVFSPMNNQFTSTIFARKGFLKEKGLTPQSPLKDKVLGLKGETIGVTSVGSGVDFFIRYLLKQNGLDPEKDVTITPTGDSGATLAAMQKGIIDVTLFSPPVPQKAIADGFGETYIDTIAGEVPSVKGMIFTAMGTTPEIVKSKHDALVAFTRALARADIMIQKEPAKAADAARKLISGIDSSLYGDAFNEIAKASPQDPKVTTDGIRIHLTYLEFVNGKKYSFGPEAIMETKIAEEAWAQVKK